VLTALWLAEWMHDSGRSRIARGRTMASARAYKGGLGRRGSSCRAPGGGQRAPEAESFLSIFIQKKTKWRQKLRI